MTRWLPALAILVICAWISACGAQPAASNDADIVARYPHDRNAFTQGLLIDNGQLFESTGQYGQSSVRRVDLKTGRIEQSTVLSDHYFGEGLALVGRRLYQLTWKAGVALVYDRHSLERVDRFNYTGQGWGLTYDGHDLIMSDGSATLKRVDPVDFRILGRIQVSEGGRPVERLNELEYIRGEIWANVWLTDRIVRIDPSSGRVIESLDASALKDALSPGGAPDVLNGIAWDASARRLYLTGKYWNTLFEIRWPTAGSH